MRKIRTAKALFVKDSPYKPRVVRSKKAYCRKLKHKASKQMARTNRLMKFVRKDEMFAGEFKPTLDRGQEIYNLINHYIFDNGLDPAKLHIKRTRGYWGMCAGDQNANGDFFTKEIILTNRFPNLSSFVAIMAHEMVHQFQWDILSNERQSQGLGPIMSHGPSFFAWRKPLAEYNIPLSTKL